MPQERGKTRDSAEAQQTNTRQTGTAAQSPQRRQENAGARVSRWFAASAARGGLAIIGLVFLLFALGQAVGVPLLDMFANALSSQTGRWLVVAAFAVALISLAQRGIPST